MEAEESECLACASAPLCRVWRRVTACGGVWALAAVLCRKSVDGHRREALSKGIDYDDDARVHFGGGEKLWGVDKVHAAGSGSQSKTLGGRGGMSRCRPGRQSGANKHTPKIGTMVEERKEQKTLGHQGRVDSGPPRARPLTATGLLGPGPLLGKGEDSSIVLRAADATGRGKNA